MPDFTAEIEKIKQAAIDSINQAAEAGKLRTKSQYQSQIAAIKSQKEGIKLQAEESQEEANRYYDQAVQNVSNIALQRGWGRGSWVGDKTVEVNTERGRAIQRIMAQRDAALNDIEAQITALRRGMEADLAARDLEAFSEKKKKEQELELLKLQYRMQAGGSGGSSAPSVSPYVTPGTSSYKGTTTPVRNDPGQSLQSQSKLKAAKIKEEIGNLRWQRMMG